MSATASVSSGKSQQKTPPLKPLGRTGMNVTRAGSTLSINSGQHMY